MNLQLWTMVSLENSIIQIISFHITWFIYKKLTRSTLAYWKVFCLSLLGIVVSLGKGDGFYYQVVIFLALALKERREHRLTLWASLFFGAFSVLFTDLFATFTPFYVFNNLFTNMTLGEIQDRQTAQKLIKDSEKTKQYQAQEGSDLAQSYQEFQASMKVGS